jgi:hypothetical protein
VDFVIIREREGSGEQENGKATLRHSNALPEKISGGAGV